MEKFDNISIPWPDWRIVQTLGHGTYGYVYEIERDIFGRKEKAAMKVVTVPQDQSQIEDDYCNGYDEASITQKYAADLERYVSEYQLMASVKGHSNIVNCDDLAVIPHRKGIGWTLYIRMELLTPLQKIIRTHPLSPDEALKLGMDICRALVLCEQKNIIHRDIKPNNIMVSEFGDYKLGDFGIARTMDHATNATLGMGTTAYIAPEITKTERYDKTVDIYSLGLVLYWLLNNRRLPFLPTNRVPKENEIPDAYKRRLNGEPIPEPLNGSKAFKRIVLKACAYDPKKRYASASDMLKDLQAVTDEENREPGEPGAAGIEAAETETAEETGTANVNTENFRDTESVFESTAGNGWADTQGTMGVPGGKKQKAWDESQYDKTMGVHTQGGSSTKRQQDEKEEKQKVKATAEGKKNTARQKKNKFILCLIFAMNIGLIFAASAISDGVWNGEILCKLLLPMLVTIFAIFLLRSPIIAGIAGGITGLCSTIMFLTVLGAIIPGLFNNGILMLLLCLSCIICAVFIGFIAYAWAEERGSKKAGGQR